MDLHLIVVRLLFILTIGSALCQGTSNGSTTPYALVDGNPKTIESNDSQEINAERNFSVVANGSSSPKMPVDPPEISTNISSPSPHPSVGKSDPLPHNETSSTLQPPSTTTLTTILVKTIEDYHKYYKSQVVTSDRSKHWVDERTMLEAAKHQTLSESYRSAATILLSFPFTFYGHEVNQVTIATGGFLYMSEFLHQWLTATQYIAPLMANFDTQIGNNSHIRYLDNGTVFVVWWEDVHLQDDFGAGHFSFQVMLHKNSSIIFSYKEVPNVSLTKIPSQRHPVKVGLSDAYYMDKPTSSEHPF